MAFVYLTPKDQANIFEIPASEDFSDGLTGMQLLYRDRTFSKNGDQDGYTFIQEITFEEFDDQGFQAGLFTQVPNTGNYSGWVCSFEQASDPVCTSHFVTDLLQSPAPSRFDPDESNNQWKCDIVISDTDVVTNS